MRTTRYVAWAAVAALVLTVSITYFLIGPLANGGSASSIGGPFTLTTHEGKTLTSKDLKGEPFALFFGFTFCPDVCPTTLLELGQSIKELGPDADRMRYLFVTVDPERDTPEQLKLYLSSFDPHITGLTGTPDEIAAVAKAYRASFEKVANGDTYTMNHSALVYLMDADGKFASVLAYGMDPKRRLEKLKTLIGAS